MLFFSWAGPARWMAATAAVAFVAGASEDSVASLPGYGPVPGRQYAGYVPVNETFDKHLFYWFVEREAGSTSGQTPLILWLNGGPGASSLTGLLLENIGPLQVQLDGTLKMNPHAWTRSYNVLAFDNPVGAGYSYTKPGGYVTSEEEMRKEYYAGLTAFFAIHPEYRTNPLWVAGESYGGKYVPNVALEIHLRGELPLQGVLVGNGVYSPKHQYPTVPQYAFAQGLLDDHAFEAATSQMASCVALIEEGRHAEAMHFCEDGIKVIYGGSGDGKVFYYDIGIADASFLDHATAAMSKFLNSSDTRSALHVGQHFWFDTDEEGPVSDALVADFTTDQVMPVIEALLETHKYEIVFYNGVRDGSVCNHMGNLASLLQLQWGGQQAFQAAGNVPWLLNDTLAGYTRASGRLTYVTIFRTGHLVPMTVPEELFSIVQRFVGATESPGGPVAADRSILV